ncbi:LOW QUALITY PROTEIN: hypothetical protein JCM19046_670 [Bacillus sp. JCM 19046]|nr:LOW QUALITY PROTEIN: hypothetical protein JCM19046_670 [Bacillus sp. JCM 19046]
MKGLLMNHVFITEKTIRNYGLLAIVIVVALYLSGHSLALRGAGFVPFLFLIQPAFEVLKHDALSGWHKFVITLPIKRATYVQSHYLLCLILIGSAAIISLGLFLLAQLLIDFDTILTFYLFFFRGMGIVLIIAALVYPLTFKLGIENLTQSSSLAVLVRLDSSSQAQSYFLYFTSSSNDSVDLIFSLIFLVISFILFLLSCLISSYIFNQKEY